MARTPRIKPTPTKRRPEDRRDALLEAALALFSERGFYGTNVPLILESANVSAGAMYNQFASKEELVNVLYQRCSTMLTAALWEGFSEVGSFRKQFGELWKRLSDFASKHPKELGFLESHNHASYLDKESQEAERGRWQRLRLFFEGAQGQGVVRPAPIEVLLPLLWGGFIGVLRSQFMGQTPLQPADLLEAERSLWEAIRA
jgi:TetR/AcrR family transcriptional regulator, repressor of fatR-cypB operon